MARLSPTRMAQPTPVVLQVAATSGLDPRTVRRVIVDRKRAHTKSIMQRIADALRTHDYNDDAHRVESELACM